MTQLKILIEYYHKNILENLVAPLGTRPDILMFYYDPAFFTVSAVYDTFLVCKKYIPHAKLEVGTYHVNDFRQIKEKLAQYIEENPKDELTVDLSGAKELGAAAAYELSLHSKLDLIYTDIRNFRIFSIRYHNRRYPCQKISVEDIIEAVGGKVIYCADSSYLDGCKKDFLPVAQKLVRDADLWFQICQFLQRNGKHDGKDRLHFSASYRENVKVHNAVLEGDIFEFFADHHLIRNLHKDEETLSFTYRDKICMHALTTFGTWLELLVYYAMKESKKFYDVRNSMEIDWNRKDKYQNVGNEIDVTAMYGCVPVVISCKMSEKSTDADALNELYTVSHRMSRGHVVRVLVTYSKIKKKKTMIYLKAKEMGIIVLDEIDIKSENFTKRLENEICDGSWIIR